MRYEVSDIAHKVIKEDEEGWLDVALKATVQNKSNEEIVIVELQGIDGEGFEVYSTYLKGHVPRGNSKVLTTKEYIEKATYQMITNWQQR